MTKKIKGGTVVIEGKANLKDIIKEGDKASKSLDKTKKSAQSADRQLKGAARASSGASKNFSKMSQGITGGLVPAYATLAANLFALDAVFRFLKDSADFRVLKEGQLAFAAATGVAYESLARDLQRATNGMISFREAAQAGAIGRAAGLSAGQLRELSEAAFTVSVALGRDVTDSFNRLIRGVTKAEPELLDELGIILRLEEATTKYAAALGLNKNQLSIYQKSQAVVNEVLTQAETKFGKINAIMEPNANAIAQLGIAFEETIDMMRPAIATVAEFFARFGKANIDVLTFAILGFAGGIIKSVMPAQAELAEKQRLSAEYYSKKLTELRIKQDQLAASKRALANTPIAQQNLLAEMDSQGKMFGGQIGRDLKAGKALSGQQIGNLKSQLTGRGGNPIGVFKDMTKAQQATVKKALNQMKADGGKMSKSMKLNLKSAGVSMQTFGTAVSSTSTKVQGAMSRMSAAVVSGVGKMMTALAVISIIYMVGKALLNFFTKPSKAQEAFNERMQESTHSIKTFNGELSKMREVRAQGLIEGVAEGARHTAEAFASADLQGKLKEFEILRQSAHLNREAFNEFSDELAFTFNSLGEISGDQRFIDAANDIRNGIQVNTRELLKQADAIKGLGAAFTSLTQLQGEFIKANNRIAQSLPKVPFQDIILLLQQQSKELKVISEQIPSYLADLALVNAQLEQFTMYRQLSLTAKLEETDIKRQKQLSFLMTRTEKANLAMRDVQNKLLKKEVDFAVALQTINQATQKDKTIAMQDNLVLAEKELAMAEEAFRIERIKQSLIAQTSIKVAKDMTADLGKAFGAALRGDSSLFEKIGENMVKTITDAIGQKLSEQFMDAMLPEALKGKTVGDQILSAGEQHAKDVKEGIEDGAFYHASELARVADGQALTLRTLTEKILTAQMGVETRKRGELVTRKGKLETEAEDLKKKSTAGSLLEFKDTPEFKTQADAYLQRTMSTTELQVIQKYQDSKKKSDAVIMGFLRGENDLLDGAGGGFFTSNVGSYEEALAQYEKTNPRVTDPTGANKPSHYNRYQDASAMTYAERVAMLEESGYSLSKGKMGNVTGVNNVVGGFEGGNADRANAILDQAGQRFFTYLETNMLDNQERLHDLTGGTDGNGIIDAVGTQIDGIDTIIGNAEDGTGIAGALKNLEVPLGDLSKKVEKPVRTEPVEGEDDENGPFKVQTEFQKNLTRFGGTIGLLGAVAGQEEKTAKVMATVAKMQMILTTMQMAREALDAGKGKIGKTLLHFFGFGGARQGGIMSKHGRSYSDGGIASGPNAGYGAILHGREAVIPLPNGRSIPVDMGKGSGMTNNTNITVNIDDSGSSSTVDSDAGAQLGNVINAVVQDRLEKEMRPGGILGG